MINQVQECQRLFEQLKDNLHIQLEECYRIAVVYREGCGDLWVSQRYPQRYVTEGSKCLGRWLAIQRRVHNGNHSGLLTGAQELHLEELSIVRDDLWHFNREGYFAQVEVPNLR